MSSKELHVGSRWFRKRLRRWPFLRIIPSNKTVEEAAPAKEFGYMNSWANLSGFHPKPKSNYHVRGSAKTSSAVLTYIRNVATPELSVTVSTIESVLTAPRTTRSIHFAQTVNLFMEAWNLKLRLKIHSRLMNESVPDRYSLKPDFPSASSHEISSTYGLLHLPNDL